VNLYGDAASHSACFDANSLMLCRVKLYLNAAWHDVPYELVESVEITDDIKGRVGKATVNVASIKFRNPDRQFSPELFETFTPTGDVHTLQFNGPEQADGKGFLRSWVKVAIQFKMGAGAWYTRFVGYVDGAGWKETLGRANENYVSIGLVDLAAMLKEVKLDSFDLSFAVENAWAALPSPGLDTSLVHAIVAKAGAYSVSVPSAIRCLYDYAPVEGTAWKALAELAEATGAIFSIVPDSNVSSPGEVIYFGDSPFADSVSFDPVLTFSNDTDEDENSFGYSELAAGDDRSNLVTELELKFQRPQKIFQQVVWRLPECDGKTLVVDPHPDEEGDFFDASKKYYGKFSAKAFENITDDLKAGKVLLVDNPVLRISTLDGGIEYDGDEEHPSGTCSIHAAKFTPGDNKALVRLVNTTALSQTIIDCSILGDPVVSTDAVTIIKRDEERVSTYGVHTEKIENDFLTEALVQKAGVAPGSQKKLCDLLADYVYDHASKVRRSYSFSCDLPLFHIPAGLIVTITETKQGTEISKVCQLTKNHISYASTDSGPEFKCSFSAIEIDQDWTYEGVAGSTPEILASSRGYPTTIETFIFMRAASQPETPTGNDPSGWYDGPPAGTDPLWVSKGTKTREGILVGAWKEPVRLDGEQGPKGDPGAPGEDAPNLLAQYSTDKASWHSTPADVDSWMRTSSDGGSTWGDPVKIRGESGNLVRSERWRVGQFPEGFSLNGTESENALVWGANPFGVNAVLWEGKGAGNDADGGWSGEAKACDPTKKYRYLVFIKKTTADATSMACWGPSRWGNVATADGTPQSNPYFLSDTLSSCLNKWLLIEAFVFPYDHSGDLPAGRVFDCETGQQVLSAVTFKWADAGQSTQLERAHLYYNTDPACRCYFYGPRIEVCDGTEQSIDSILAAAKAAYLASAAQAAAIAAAAADATSKANAAQGNAEAYALTSGLGLRLNASAITGYSAGKCYVHGFDASGAIANVDGYIFDWTSTKRTVKMGIVDAHAEMVGYIVAPLDGSISPKAAYLNYSDNKFYWFSKGSVSPYNPEFTKITDEMAWMLIGELVYSGIETVESGSLYQRAKPLDEARKIKPRRCIGVVGSVANWYRTLTSYRINKSGDEFTFVSAGTIKALPGDIAFVRGSSDSIKALRIFDGMYWHAPLAADAADFRHLCGITLIGASAVYGASAIPSDAGGYFDFLFSKEIYANYLKSITVEFEDSVSAIKHPSSVLAPGSKQLYIGKDPRRPDDDSRDLEFALQELISLNGTKEVWMKHFITKKLKTGGLIGLLSLGGLMSSCEVLSSPGKVWNEASHPFTTELPRAVAYGNGIWVIVGYSGYSGRIVRSGNMSFGSFITNPFTSAYIKSVAYGNGVWVAVGSSGKIARSIDNGLTWGSLISNPMLTINSVAYGNGVWLVGGISGSIARSTDNGLTWGSLISTPFGSSAITALTYGNGVWLAVSEPAKIARSVDNGASWGSLAIEPFSYSSGFFGIAFSDDINKFVIVGYSSIGGMVIHSDFLEAGGGVIAHYYGSNKVSFKFSSGLLIQIGRFYCRGSANGWANENYLIPFTRPGYVVVNPLSSGSYGYYPNFVFYVSAERVDGFRVEWHSANSGWYGVNEYGHYHHYIALGVA